MTPFGYSLNPESFHESKPFQKVIIFSCKRKTILYSKQTSLERVLPVLTHLLMGDGIDPDKATDRLQNFYKLRVCEYS